MVWSNSTGAVRSRRSRLSRSSSPPLSSSSHYRSIDIDTTFEEENEETKRNANETPKNIGKLPEQKKPKDNRTSWVPRHLLTEASPAPPLPSETPAALLRDVLTKGAERLSTSLFLSNSWDQAQASCEKDIYRSPGRPSLRQGVTFSRFASILKRGGVNDNQTQYSSGPCRDSNALLPSLQTSFAEVEDDSVIVPNPFKVQESRTIELSTQIHNIHRRDSKQIMTYVTNTDVSSGSSTAMPPAKEAPEVLHQKDQDTRMMSEVKIDESPLHDKRFQDADTTRPKAASNNAETPSLQQISTFRPSSLPHQVEGNFQGLTSKSSIAFEVGRGTSNIYPPFQFSELVLGKKIGSGGFCIVHDIVDIKLRKGRQPQSRAGASDSMRRSQDEEYQRAIHVLREQMAKTCVDRERHPPPYPLNVASQNSFAERLSKLVSAPPKVHRSAGAPSSPLHLSYNYVIKMLRHDIPEEELRKGVTDMAIESNYLQSLSHQNIISLRGTADVDTLNNRADFFLILEKLQCTLDRRLKEWRREVGRAKMGYCCFPFGLLCPNQPRLHSLWEDRFVAAHGIASAIEYLHSKRIVYRDLKPENVGFDVAQNKVKIFDFGLAKTLPSEEDFASDGTFSTTSSGVAGASARDPDTGLYHLTGNTGSLRYMAPEVALNQPYDQRVDAYSFGILFWQICALSVPYGGYSCKMHSDLVVNQGYRPKVYPSWPEHWGQLMRECWAGDVNVRPTFSHIASVMAQQLDEMQGTAFAPTFKHRKAKEEKVGKEGKVLDADTRVVQMGNESQIDMVNLPCTGNADVPRKEADFVQPEAQVV